MQADVPSQLASSTRVFIGKTLFCKPIGGWGWTHYLGSDLHSVPRPFHFHLLELFEWNDVLRGGFGLVAELEHTYHGHWLSFHTYNGGVNDFYNNAFSCVVSFFSEKPRFLSAAEDPEMAALWPLLDVNRNRMSKVCVKSHLAFGYGEVAANEDVLLGRDRMRKMKSHPEGRSPY